MKILFLVGTPLLAIVAGVAASRVGGEPMRGLLLSGCVSVILIAPSAALAQVKPSDIHEHGAVACIESPTPGKRPLNADCAILLQKKFSSLPPGPLVWRFENFPTVKAAQDASTPASVVVEAAGKIWLLTLAAKGGGSKGGTLVAETEPLPPIPPGQPITSLSQRETSVQKPM